jgi:hypothetical protein
MSTTIGNGNITFGDNTVQSTAWREIATTRSDLDNSTYVATTAFVQRFVQQTVGTSPDSTWHAGPNDPSSSRAWAINTQYLNPYSKPMFIRFGVVIPASCNVTLVIGTISASYIATDYAALGTASTVWTSVSGWVPPGHSYAIVPLGNVTIQNVTWYV